MSSSGRDIVLKPICSLGIDKTEGWTRLQGCFLNIQYPRQQILIELRKDYCESQKKKWTLIKH